MQLNAEGFETAAAGANERADMLLMAWRWDHEFPVVLGCCYHTTNWVRNTFSDRPDQVFPGSRLLWRHFLPLYDHVFAAVLSLSLNILISMSLAHVKPVLLTMSRSAVHNGDAEESLEAAEQASVHVSSDSEADSGDD